MSSVRKIIVHQTPKAQSKGIAFSEVSAPMTPSLSRRSQLERPQSNASRHNILMKKATSEPKLFNVKTKAISSMKEGTSDISRSQYFSGNSDKIKENASEMYESEVPRGHSAQPSISFVNQSLAASIVPAPEKYNCHSQNERDVAYRNYLEMLYQRNSNYLNHLQGDCICGQCICGHCRCPDYRKNLDQFSSTKTIYQKDFDGKNPGPSLKINPRMYEMHSSDVPMDGKSIQMSDYIPHYNNPYAIIKAPHIEKEPLPFAGVSSYQESYLYWGTTPASLLKPPVYGTVVPNLKFHDKTTYQDSFKNNNPNVVFVKRPKGNIQHDLPFLSETTHHAAFQPFKLGGVNENYKQKKAPEPIPSFGGQFNTQAMANYNDKGNLKCPSREMLNEYYKSRLGSEKYNPSEMEEN